ncbi:hypothetical protein [Streptomyces laurentii]
MLHRPGHHAARQVLAPLPVETMHGIGPAQTAALKRYNLHTTGLLTSM